MKDPKKGLDEIHNFLDKLQKVMSELNIPKSSDKREKVLKVTEFGKIVAVDKYPSNVISIFKNLE